jgi:hypothetical protein
MLVVPSPKGKPKGKANRCISHPDKSKVSNGVEGNAPTMVGDANDAPSGVCTDERTESSSEVRAMPLTIVSIPVPSS